ncbi:Rossmann-like domain-containing protein [Acidobacteriota bacterium]
MMALNLEQTPSRAVFIAAMNALLRNLELAGGTVHCRNEDPMRCGPELVSALEQRYGARKTGLIGLQPSILKALVHRYGFEAVRVSDLDQDNIGREKRGVTVWDGETGLDRLIAWCDLGLCTGSTIVNGTIDGIIRRFQEADKTVVFFGNTISGTAQLLSLEHLCPYGR